MTISSFRIKEDISQWTPPAIRMIRGCSARKDPEGPGSIVSLNVPDRSQEELDQALRKIITRIRLTIVED